MCVVRQPAAKSKLKRFVCPACDTQGSPLMQKEDGQGVLRTVIEKGTVRVGSLDDMSGSYGRFVHVTCWRVPQKVWEKLPDPPADVAIFLKAMLEMDAVIFKGFGDLEIDDQRAIVEHMMDKANWTRHDADGKCNLKRKPKDAEAPALEGPAKKAKVIDLTGESPVKSETKKAPAKKKKKAAPKQGKAIAVVSAAADSAAIEIASPQKERFVIPRPGVGNAVAGALVLDGKPLTVVMTGLFPEIGGGAGLSLGKDKTKAMLTSFGAKVTGSVSGKTDILLCGKEPGMSKVTKGRNAGKCTLMGLEGLCEGLRENKVPETIAYFKANPWQVGRGPPPGRPPRRSRGATTDAGAGRRGRRSPRSRRATSGGAASTASRARRPSPSWRRPPRGRRDPMRSRARDGRGRPPRPPSSLLLSSMAPRVTGAPRPPPLNRRRCSPLVTPPRSRTAPRRAAPPASS